MTESAQSPIGEGAAMTLGSLQLLKLMHVCSVSLPVGGYSFSHGLEYAIDAGWTKTPADIRQWICLQIQHSLARVDLPLLRQAMQACRRKHSAKLIEVNALILACRESKELRMTDLAMGEALNRLLPVLGVVSLMPDQQDEPASFVTHFAQAAVQADLDDEAACHGYLWAWLENQVAAATKLLPMGQTQAQTMLVDLQRELPEAVAASALLPVDDVGSCLPALAMASALHETQYSRLFRS